MERVVISSAAVAGIARHLCSIYPREGCGVLLAKPGRVLISEAVPVTNIAEPGVRDRYQLEPFEQAAVERKAAERNLVIAGFFHSHPDTPPKPSQIDLDAARGLYEFAKQKYLYVIQTTFARGVGQLACWEFNGDNFIELAWEPVPGEVERRDP